MTGTGATPRRARELVADAFGLYWRYPLLFLGLAAAVIVPYQLIVLAATGTGPFEGSSLSAGVSLLLTASDWFLITPLVSALHVHAVREAREGDAPRFGPVARQGLRALPVVAAASIMSELGIALGFVALIVPGIFLTLRWFVVAQTAAIEGEGWLPALRRSGQLTDRHYLHLVVVAIYVALITMVPSLAVGFRFGPDTTPASFLVGVAVEVVTWSFAALATALLYYDLRTRWELSAAVAHAAPELGDDSRGPQESWDPSSYSDHARPDGWYVDPSRPSRMRYWTNGDQPRWTGTARTPRKIRKTWRQRS
jgi:hypothetical protein